MTSPVDTLPHVHRLAITRHLPHRHHHDLLRAGTGGRHRSSGTVPIPQPFLPESIIPHWIATHRKPDSNRRHHASERSPP